MCKSALCLLSVWNLMSPLCSSTTVSYMMWEFWWLCHKLGLYCWFCNAQTWFISTSSLKSVITIMFLDPDFLYDAEIPAICKHLRQKVIYLCLHGFSGPFGPKMAVFWGKIGKGWCSVDPQQTHSCFWGLLPLCHFWRKSIKKCDLEHADRQTDRHMLWQRQTEFIICLMHYSYGADKYMFKFLGDIITDWFMYSVFIVVLCTVCSKNFTSKTW